MPALVAGIHALAVLCNVKGVDGRDKPGQDERERCDAMLRGVAPAATGRLQKDALLSPSSCSWGRLLASHHGPDDRRTAGQITMTRVPVGTRWWRSMMSSFISRTQPEETAWPMVQASVVPWMR